MFSEEWCRCLAIHSNEALCDINGLPSWILLSSTESYRRRPKIKITAFFVRQITTLALFNVNWLLYSIPLCCLLPSGRSPCTSPFVHLSNLIIPAHYYRIVNVLLFLSNCFAFSASRVLYNRISYSVPACFALHNTIFRNISPSNTLITVR